MSTTPTTVGIPAQPWSVKRFTILTALMLALVAGVFGVYSLINSPEATTAAGTALVEDSRAGGDGCSASFVAAGGLVEGQSVSNTCGAAGGSGTSGGIQP